MVLGSATRLFLADAPPGFVRELVESRFVAIVLGVSALVTLGLWFAWQLRVLRSLDEEEGAPSEGSETRGER